MDESDRHFDHSFFLKVLLFCTFSCMLHVIVLICVIFNDLYNHSVSLDLRDADTGLCKEVGEYQENLQQCLQATKGLLDNLF